MEMELITKIALFIAFCIIGLFMGACSKRPKPPDPDPEPEPEKEWKDFFPRNWKIPVIDWGNKWRKRAFGSPLWLEYEQKVEGLYKQVDRPFDDTGLSRMLMLKLPDGRYLFKWTSDMDIWGVEDYWATPPEFLVFKDADGNENPNGLYRGDCDVFAGMNCDILYRMMKYPLVWWLEIYWQRQSGGVWRGLGHAITVYKRELEDNFRVFCNQSWVGMSYGYKDIEDVVQLYVPTKTLPDNYNLLYVKARHPLTGKLLWQIQGKDWA